MMFAIFLSPLSRKGITGDENLEGHDFYFL